MRIKIVFVLLLASSILASGCKFNGKYPIYDRCDPRWENVANGKDTVCSSGILVPVVASALAALGKKINGQVPDPGNLSEYMTKLGPFEHNRFWSWKPIAKLGVKYEKEILWDAIKAAICEGKVVILTPYFTAGFATGYDETSVNYISPDGRPGRIVGRLPILSAIILSNE